MYMYIYIYIYIYMYTAPPADAHSGPAAPRSESPPGFPLRRDSPLEGIPL